MLRKEKASFTRVKNSEKLERLNRIVGSLVMKKTDLSFHDKSYLLRVALLFIDRFQKDKTLKANLEFAYFLILKYSLLYSDFKPLYDFAVNFGLYPIAKAINNTQDSDIESLNKVIIEDLLSDFVINQETGKEFVAIKEQKEILDNFKAAAQKEIAYIAPTSYGKSQLIFEHIQSSIRVGRHNKYAIIVPTKSLIAQTHREVRSLRLGLKIITHDEMYNNDKAFIAILTQERALRLLQHPGLSFDILYIDEAHNLFEDDQRNVLLSRLIRLNELNNKNQQLIYLSPLINDPNNLRIIENDNIKEFRIDFSIKEPQYIVRDVNGRSEYYNRFLDTFFPANEIKKNDVLLDYIQENSSEKNFVFLNTPRKIEELAKMKYEHLKAMPDNPDNELEKISKILSEHVHEDYNGTRYINKGIIYLHGKTPTAIKDYLEYKFRELDNIKYMIANHVVLQGINMPISSLFIVRGYRLKQNDIVNLVGRVNRLNDIFGSTPDLKKLEPKIFLVDNYDFNNQPESLRNKTEFLRSNDVVDTINNPILQNFDIAPLQALLEKARAKNKEEEIRRYENKIEKIIVTKTTEDFLIQPKENLTELETLKKDLIRSGLNYAYDLSDICLAAFNANIRQRKNTPNFKKLDIIDKIYLIFIHGITDFITDYEIKRLENSTARKYYRIYMDKYRKLSLKDNANVHMNYFKKMRAEGEVDLYIGEQFGENFKSTEAYNEGSRKVYINLSAKNDAQLINIAIIKVKIEDDFTRNKIKNLIALLYQWQLIELDEYNLQVHGTNDHHQLQLIKQGLPFHLISKLQNEEQIDNIDIDENGNISVNTSFNNYLEGLDDFIQFEIRNSLGI